MGKFPVLFFLSALMVLACGESVQTPIKLEAPKEEALPVIPSSELPPASTQSPPPSSTEVSPPTHPPTEPSTTTTTTTTTTTPKSTTAVPTIAPPMTTTTTTTTTTPKPITTPPTTPKPTTTTAPTTTPPPTKPTTTAPTTTAAPTAKPVPPANVDPKENTWTFNDTATNTSCIVIQVAMQVVVPYPTKDNSTWSAYVDVPVTANASGHCNKDEQDLMLSWGNNSMDFHFTMKNDHYYLDALQVKLETDAVNFPNIKNATVLKMVHNTPEFNVSKTMSYKCNAMKSYNLTNGSSAEVMGTIHISRLHLEAFSNYTGKGYKEAVDCAPANTPDIIPIATGCALAALIVIVLLAYLIGKRRAQSRGYFSM